MEGHWRQKNCYLEAGLWKMEFIDELRDYIIICYYSVRWDADSTIAWKLAAKRFFRDQ